MSDGAHAGTSSPRGPPATDFRAKIAGLPVNVVVRVRQESADGRVGPPLCRGHSRSADITLARVQAVIEGKLVKLGPAPDDIFQFSDIYGPSTSQGGRARRPRAAPLAAQRLPSLQATSSRRTCARS
jgi:hypothetical protein